jgi:hypothetical protein
MTRARLCQTPPKYLVRSLLLGPARELHGTREETFTDRKLQTVLWWVRSQAQRLPVAARQQTQCRPTRKADPTLRAAATTRPAKTRQARPTPLTAERSLPGHHKIHRRFPRRRTRPRRRPPRTGKIAPRCCPATVSPAMAISKAAIAAQPTPAAARPSPVAAITCGTSTRPPATRRQSAPNVLRRGRVLLRRVDPETRALVDAAVGPATVDPYGPGNRRR